jgi:hypothetical protein
MAVKKCAAHLYSCDSFLYKLVNSTLRNNDLSKIDTLGPFCYLLSKYLPFKRPVGYLSYTVYRGTKVNMEMIEEYRAAVGKRIIWTAFTSTTKDYQVAECFSDNALFIIEVIGSHTQGVRDISSLSRFPDEREVLFCAGQSFTVLKIERNSNSGKYLIYILA